MSNEEIIRVLKQMSELARVPAPRESEFHSLNICEEQVEGEEEGVQPSSGLEVLMQRGIEAGTVACSVRLESASARRDARRMGARCILPRAVSAKPVQHAHQHLSICVSNEDPRKGAMLGLWLADRAARKSVRRKAKQRRIAGLTGELSTLEALTVATSKNAAVCWCEGCWCQREQLLVRYLESNSEDARQVREDILSNGETVVLNALPTNRVETLTDRQATLLVSQARLFRVDLVDRLSNPPPPNQLRAWTAWVTVVCALLYRTAPDQLEQAERFFSRSIGDFESRRPESFLSEEQRIQMNRLPRTEVDDLLILQGQISARYFNWLVGKSSQRKGTKVKVKRYPANWFA